MFNKAKKFLSALVCAGVAATSVPVSTLTADAADNNYLEALATSLYFFDSNACGTGITDGPLTWRGDCHTYDAEASLSDASNFNSAATSILDPDGDGKVDVSGGFHDAGDHIKFSLTIGFGASSLAMSEYLFPGIYEKAGCRDHLEYELRRAADYFMKVTALDSSDKVLTMCSVVSDVSDHSYWQSPEIQTYNRPTYWLTSGQNNSAVCGDAAAALGGAAYIFKDSDPTYSAKCLKYAKAIYDFGKNNSGNYCGGMGGMYDSAADAQDELLIAQTWMWLCGAGSKPSVVPNNGQYGGVYDYYKYTWDKQYQGYAAMMYKATGDSAFYNELKMEYNNAGGLSESQYKANDWGGSRYNCAVQMDALMLAKGDTSANSVAESSYAKAAKFQMDYILGNNSYNYSFLVGYGSNWPTHIHHRAANPGENGQTSADNPSAKYTNYGLLIGGPDSSGYQDHADSWYYTEGALDYNGCFAIACAGLADIYGGDATAMKKLAASASEINENFDFGGNGSSQPATTTTTTETTTTTTTTTTSTTTTAPAPTTTTAVVTANFVERVNTIASDSNGTYIEFESTGKFYLGTQDIINTVNSVGTGKAVNVEAVYRIDGDGVRTITALSNYYAMGLGSSVPGDANDDGEVSVADPTLIMQAAANPNVFTVTNPVDADVIGNGDGVTSQDALTIQKFLASGGAFNLPVTE